MAEPSLKILDTPQAIRELTEYLGQYDLIAFDVETTGISRRDQIIGFSVCAEDDMAFYIILSRWDATTAALVDLGLKDAAAHLVRSLVGKRLIMHNGVFDCMMVESFFRISLIDSLHTDTMVLAHLLDENRRVGLKELAKSMFGVTAAKEQEEMKASIMANGGKATKDCYEMYKADSFLLGKYGAKDALLTYRIFLRLVEDLFAQGLDSFFYEEESMPLLRGPTYELNTVGLSVDSKELGILKRTLEAEILEDRNFIMNEVAAHVKDKYPGTSKANTFNIGASQQLAWLMFGKLGLEFNTLTKEGKVVCKALGLRLPYTAAAKREFIAVCEQRKGEIYQPEGMRNGKKTKPKKVRDPWAYTAADKMAQKKHAPRFKWAARLLDLSKKVKLLTAYVEGIESRQAYGIVQPSFLQHGTSSGRYASRNPNFQNLPKNDKRVKKCIVARPGKVFVGADYSQLEPRVFAYLSGDANIIKAFNEPDTDFYSTIGMGIFLKTDCTASKLETPDAFKVKYASLRDSTKVVALASVYGAGAWRLSRDTGKSVEETQMIIDNYFETFPGVRKLMDDSHEEVKKNGFVTNIFGRPRRMPAAKRISSMYPGLPHDDLPYEERKMLNLAVNHKTQSGGASIVNRAAIRFSRLCKEAKIEVKLVLQVHDSLIAECLEADAANVAILLQEAMENTTPLPGVPLEAIPKIGKNLAEV